MNKTTLFTGFPGFLGRHLVARLAELHPEQNFTLLSEKKLYDRSIKAVMEIEERVPGFLKRAELVTGDITDPRLGLSEEEYNNLSERVEQIWHLAAIYDLAVPYEFAYRVNVEGTQHIIDLARAAKNFQRFHYFSTCFVAGDRTGLIYEDELDKGQKFKNHYESTKFMAEMRVRYFKEKIPTVIYRPSIVVGDSRTGDTDKYDGPYLPLLMLLKLPAKITPAVYLGKGNVTANIIPVDFCTEAVIHISQKPGVEGKTFVIADPAPGRVCDFWKLLMEKLGFGTPGPVIPMPVVKKLMESRSMRQLFGMPTQSLDYFEHPADFDCSNMLSALEGSGLRCPPAADYIDVMISFTKAHPELNPLRKQIL
jgi:thioester reductase-like protein